MSRGDHKRLVCHCEQRSAADLSYDWHLSSDDCDERLGC